MYMGNIENMKFLIISLFTGTLFCLLCLGTSGQIFIAPYAKTVPKLSFFMLLVWLSGVAMFQRDCYLQDQFKKTDKEILEDKYLMCALFYMYVNKWDSWSGTKLEYL